MKDIILNVDEQKCILKIVAFLVEGRLKFH